MLEFPDKGTSWLLKKRDLAASYCMESEETSRKRKRQELLENEELIKRAEASSFDHQKRRRFSEDSTNKNHNNIEEGYYHQRMSLNLELNLSTSLIDLNHHDHDHGEDERKKKGSVLGTESMAWVAFDLDDNGCGSRGGGGEEEMVAKVCMKCHMLVMFCKASPVCPNCKFMHSPEDTSLSLLFTAKPTLLA
uniref:Uncharacterized protein n=3 Tax=Noccaea caerulescens TaxID=107243 RepID=A0A1J3I4X1_NOCCA